MSRASRALRAIAAGALLVVAGAMPVAAADPTAATVTITVPEAPIVCRVETEVSALVLDASGATIAGATVTWSLMPIASSQDSVVDGETTTGSQGVATTRIWIDCIPGLRTLNATAGPVTASVDLVVSTAGMPETSTEPPPSAPAGEDTTPVAAALMIGAALAGVALFGLRTSRAG
jgi:hypothetical protein